MLQLIALPCWASPRDGRAFISLEFSPEHGEGVPLLLEQKSPLCQRPIRLPPRFVFQAFVLDLGGKNNNPTFTVNFLLLEIWLSRQPFVSLWIEKQSVSVRVRSLELALFVLATWRTESCSWQGRGTRGQGNRRCDKEGRDIWGSVKSWLTTFGDPWLTPPWLFLC